jgi:hypothetical protein
MGFTGPGFGFDPGDFFGALVAIYQALISALIAVFTFLWNTILLIGNFLLKGLLAVIQFLGHAFTVVARFFQHIWENVLKPFFKTLLKDYMKFRAWLQKILGPYLRYIQKIQKWISLNIIRHIKQVIAIIQRVRSILAIFKLLGFSWAAKLDAYLRKAQTVLTTVIQDIVKGLNTVTTLLELVLDPSIIFRKNIWGATLLSYLGPFKRVMDYGGNRALDPDEQARVTQDGQMLSNPNSIVVRNADGSITYSPAFQRISDGYDQSIQKYGQPVPKS